MCLNRTVENHKQTQSAAMILHLLTLRSRSINQQVHTDRAGAI